MLCSVRFIQCGLSQLLLHCQKNIKKMKILFLLDCDWPTYHVFTLFVYHGKKIKMKSHVNFYTW